LLLTANIWADILGIVLLVVTAIIPVYFFVMNLLTGRLKERFIDYHWHFLESFHIPWDEEHPMPIRIWHWINLFAFIFFFFTGFYIRYPFFAYGRNLMRYLHYVAMYACFGAFIYRIWFMFTTDDYQNFKYSRKDLPVLLQVVQYYIGLKSHYDHISKYHVIQRGSYIVIYALIPIQAFTGFALVWPQALLGFWAGPFGGVAALAGWMRLIHTLLMRVFLMLAVTHGSLSVYEGFPSIKYFWFGIPDPLPNVHGHGDDHSGGGDHH